MYSTSAIERINNLAGLDLAGSGLDQSADHGAAVVGLDGVPAPVAGALLPGRQSL